MGEFAIGQSVSRFEDPRLVQGRGNYTDDVQLPGMAYGVVVRSPHGHAKILSIDTVTAKAAPGVRAVITAADWKAAKLNDLPSHSGLKRRDGSAMLKPRYPVLAEDRVRWVGDPVAFVVADTPAQSRSITKNCPPSSPPPRR
jgi:carbon-monoxide dehydrogenase large subunit